MRPWTLVRQVLFLGLLAGAVAEPAAEDEAAAVAALAVDEHCAAGSGEGDCALSALQLRGQKVAIGEGQSQAKPKWGSCLQFGCVSYKEWQGCQCNVECHKYGTCCKDYATTCGTLLHMTYEDPGTCAQYGCTPNVRGQKCQCNDGCAKSGDCCADYATTCPAVQQLMAAPPPPQPAMGKIYGHPRADTNYPRFSGFTLMMVEEFDAPLDLDKDPIWTWSDGGLKEGDVRFVKEAIQFEGGKMIIEMTNTLKVPIQPCSNAEVATIAPKPLTSGEVRTRHNMFRYGIYEARIKAPYVQGNNPWVNGNFVATMFVFRDAKYKHWRELDFEITGNKHDYVSTNVLYAQNTNAWKPGIGEEKVVKLGVNVRADFHEYRIEWLPSKVTWYFDGKKIREKTAGVLPVPEMSTKIMMNLWTFEDDDVRFGGNEMWNNRYPMRSEYEWVRFYRWDGDKQYPCADFSDGCLTAEDKYLSSNNGCDGIAQLGDIYGDPAPCFATCR